MARKTKEEKQQDRDWNEFWATLVDPDARVEYDMWRNRFQLRIDGGTPFKCAFCPTGKFVFLQGALVPSSQYGIWCKSCQNAVRIQHDQLWPYIKDAFEAEREKVKGTSIEEMLEEAEKLKQNTLGGLEEIEEVDDVSSEDSSG